MAVDLEKRQMLLNKFLAKRQFIDRFLEDFIEFLPLKNMVDNETEREDLKDISQCVSLAMGSLDQAFDLIFAFNNRIQDEQILEDIAIDRS